MTCDIPEVNKCSFGLFFKKKKTNKTTTTLEFRLLTHQHCLKATTTLHGTLFGNPSRIKTKIHFPITARASSALQRQPWPG